MAKRKKRQSSRKPSKKQSRRSEPADLRWDEVEDDLRGLKVLNSMQLRVIQNLEETVRNLRPAEEPSR